MKKHIFGVIGAAIFTLTLLASSVTSAFAVEPAVGSVMTGDERNLILPGIIVGVSVIVIVAVVILKKKDTK